MRAAPRRRLAGLLFGGQFGGWRGVGWRGVGRRRAIRTVRRNVTDAGRLKVTVRASRRGRALLRRKRRARITLALVFRPVAGQSQRSTHRIRLRRAR